MEKTCTKHKIVSELFNTHHRGSLFPIGEVVPLVLAVQHRFRYHLAGKDRTHMNPLKTRHNDVVFANGGGLRPSQPPPCCLFKPCPCKTHHKGILFAKRACVIGSYYIMF